jgi:hypothetical protein
MKRYLVLIATLALIIPGLARAQFSCDARVGGVPCAGGATLLNFDDSTPFSKVVGSSSQNAFAFGDVAYAAKVRAVPEPTTRALIACGLGIGFLMLNRKRA